MTEFEKQAYQQGYKLIAGVDEVGRGCIAGPLVCAAVILPLGYQNDNIKDSKMLSAKQREKMYDIIIRDCIDYQIELIDAEGVDLLNPKQASRHCMLKCIENIRTKPDFVLIDFEKIETNIANLSLVKGDQRSISIAAASILAKVYRDRLMINLSTTYPEYDFASNKGYLTSKHRLAIEKFGPLKNIHRYSYKLLKNHSK